MAKTLTDLARLCLAEARQQLIKTGGVYGVIMIRERGGRLRRLDIPESMAWMLNHGEAKEVIFGILRNILRAEGHTAFIIAVEAWMGVSTEAGNQLLAADRDEYMRISGQGIIAMEKRGLVIRSEILACTAQSAEATVMMHQKFERGPQGFTFGPEQVMEDAAFEGRLKMF